MTFAVLAGMRAFELVQDRETRQPADAETKELARYCYEHGLVTITAGTFNSHAHPCAAGDRTDEQFDEESRRDRSRPRPCGRKEAGGRFSSLSWIFSRNQAAP